MNGKCVMVSYLVKTKKSLFYTNIHELSHQSIRDDSSVIRGNSCSKDTFLTLTTYTATPCALFRLTTFRFHNYFGLTKMRWSILYAQAHTRRQ